MDPGHQGRDRLCVCPAEQHQTTVGTGWEGGSWPQTPWFYLAFPLAHLLRLQEPLASLSSITPATSLHQLQGPRTAASGPSGQPLQSLQQAGVSSGRPKLGAQEATTHNECHTRPGQRASGSNTAVPPVATGPAHTEGCVWLQGKRPDAAKPSWTAPHHCALP